MTRLSLLASLAVFLCVLPCAPASTQPATQSYIPPPHQVVILNGQQIFELAFTCSNDNRLLFINGERIHPPAEDMVSSMTEEQARALYENVPMAESIHRDSGSWVNAARVCGEAFESLMNELQLLVQASASAISASQLRQSIHTTLSKSDYQGLVNSSKGFTIDHNSALTFYIYSRGEGKVVIRPCATPSPVVNSRASIDTARTALDTMAATVDLLNVAREYPSLFLFSNSGLVLYLVGKDPVEDALQQIHKSRISGKYTPGRIPEQQLLDILKNSSDDIKYPFDTGHLGLRGKLDQTMMSKTFAGINTVHYWGGWEDAYAAITAALLARGCRSIGILNEVACDPIPNVTLPNWATWMNNSGVFCFIAHGNSEADLMVEIVSDASSLLVRGNALAGDYPGIQMGILESAFGIIVPASKINDYIRSRAVMESGPIVVAGQCYGLYAKNQWAADAVIGYYDAETTVKADIETLFKNLGCEMQWLPLPEHRETVDQAIEGTNFDFEGTGSNSLDGTRGCSNLIDGSVSGGAFAGHVYWIGTCEEGVREYVVKYSARGSGDAEIVVPRSTREYGQWCSLYEMDLVGAEQADHVDIFAKDALQRLTHIARYSVDEAPPADWIAIRDPDFCKTREAASSSRTMAVTKHLRTEGSDALIVGRDGQMALSVEQHLAELGLAYSVLYDAALGPADIKSAYETLVSCNASINTQLGMSVWPVDPGPILVIVGAGGQCDKCVPYIEYADCCDRCRNGGICYSDYLMTDIDDDGIPNGPMTRLPVISKAQTDELIELANSYNGGDHGASYGQVMTICDDEVIAGGNRFSNGEYARSIADVVDMYDALGYTARTTLRTSIMSGDGEDWFASAVAQANEGVMEMWGFGRRFNHDNWANIVRPYGPDYWLNWNEYTRDGLFVGWMPSCKTALSDTVLHDGQCRLQRSVYGAFALPEYMITATSCKARCAALVGHIDAGWDMQHIWMNEALVQSRSGAIPGATYVAEVAYNAVRTFCDAHPDQKEYAASVGVLGGLAVVQGCEITSAGDDHGQGRGVMAAASKGGQVAIDYVSPIEGDMAMDIYDLRGRLVIQKECGAVQKGRGRWTWDGRRENGGSVGSGMYIFRMRIGGASGEFVRAVKGVIVR